MIKRICWWDNDRMRRLNLYSSFFLQQYNKLIFLSTQIYSLGSETALCHFSSVHHKTFRMRSKNKPSALIKGGFTIDALWWKSVRQHDPVLLPAIRAYAIIQPPLCLTHTFLFPLFLFKFVLVLPVQRMWLQNLGSLFRCFQSLTTSEYSFDVVEFTCVFFLFKKVPNC